MFDQAELEAIKQRSGAYQSQFQQQNKQQAAPKQNPHKSWLAAIPSLAAAGASFIPGVGTAAAAGLGGLGEFARQKLSGEKTDLKKIGVEAGLSAIPGGLGKIGKVAKIGKEAATAGKTVKAAEDATTAAKTGQSLLSRVKSRITTPPAEIPDTKLAQAGQKLRASNRGIQAGDKIGKEVLDETRAKELNDAISSANKGLTGRTVRGQVKGVQRAKQAATDELNAAAEASKGVVAPEVKQQAAKDIATGRDKILHFDKNNPAHVDLNNRYAERLNNANTAKEILEARRVFSQAAKKVYANPDATQTLDKELADVYYRQANKLLDNIAPEVRAADKKVSTYIDAEKALTSSKSKVDASGVKPFGTSVNGKGIGGSTLQAGVDSAGRALEAVGGNSKAARYGRGLTGQVAGRAGAAAFGVPMSQQTPVEQPVTEETPTSDTTTLETPATGPMGDGSMAGLGSDQIQQALQAAAVQALAKGDTQGIAAIKSVMDIVGSSSKSSKPMSAETAKLLSNAQAGLTSLDQLESILKSDPSIQQKGGVSSSFNPFGLTGRALGTSQYEAAREQARDIIARIRTGAAVTKEESKAFDKFLPQPGDPPETVQQKIAALRNQFQYIVTNSGGAGTDLQQSVTGA